MIRNKKNTIKENIDKIEENRVNTQEIIKTNISSINRDQVELITNKSINIDNKV
jgi:hypothetical protein